MQLLFTTLTLYSLIFTLTLQKNNCFYIKSKESNLNTILFISIPALMVGFYYIALKNFNAGGDTSAYLQGFSRVNSIFTATRDANYGSEILFWPIQAILKKFVDPRGWFISHFIVISVLSYYSYKKILHDSKITHLIFPLIFLTYFCVYSSNVMRQIYSIPLVAIAFHYAFEKDYLKYFFFTALSILFHWSSIIVLIAPLFILLANTRMMYIAIPLAFLSLSFIFTFTADIIISIFNFSWLTAKLNLYVYGGRISHISAVWHTLNFWLCVFIYITILILNTFEKNDKIFKFNLMFLSIMLFSIHNTDISERYMAFLLFIIPINAAIIINKTQFYPVIKNAIFIVIFLCLSLLVFTRESTIETLGL